MIDTHLFHSRTCHAISIIQKHATVATVNIIMSVFEKQQLICIFVTVVDNLEIDS